MAVHTAHTFFKKFIYSRLYLVIGVIVACLLTAGVAKQIMAKKQIDTEVGQLKSQIQQMEGSNQDLSKLVEYFNSEDYLKQEAKLKFGLREQGEQLVVLSDQKRDQKKLLANVQAQAEQISNPQKWLNYLFAGNQK